MKNKCLKDSYFQLNIMMKLKDSQQIEFYEITFIEKVMILLTVQII